MCLPLLRIALLAAAVRGATGVAAVLTGGKREVHEGMEVVWEASHNKPKALLVVVHRGGRSATSWWDVSPMCSTCTGLPEEKRIVASALAMDFAVVAVSCHNSQSKRWAQRDGPMVAHGLVSLTSALKWKKLPLFLLGVGCGAGFAATVLPKALPPSMKIHGMCLQLMSDAAGLSSEAVVKASNNGKGVVGAGWFGKAKDMLQAPPADTVAILHMPRDENVARAAKAIGMAWNGAGANVIQQRAMPQALHDTYFSDAIAGVSPLESRFLVKMLHDAKFLTDAGHLLDDPQLSAWRDVVSAPVGRQGAYELGMLRAVARDSTDPWLSPIGQEVNRAFALSETSAEFINETLRAFSSALEKKPKKSASKPKDTGTATAAASASSAKKKSTTLLS